MITFKSFLLEITLDDHYAKYASKQYPELPREIYDGVAKLDPTANGNNKGKYLDWLLKAFRYQVETFLDYTWNEDEIEMAWDRNFNGWKRTMPLLLNKFQKVGEGDINRFDSFYSFGEYCNSLPDFTKNEIDKMSKNIFTNTENIKILNSEEGDYIVAVPLTWEGSKVLARYKSPMGANWCTARANDRSAYDEYSEGGLLVCFLHKTDPMTKYQVWYSHEVFGQRHDWKNYSEFKDFYDDTVKDPQVVKDTLQYYQDDYVLYYEELY